MRDQLVYVCSVGKEVGADVEGVDNRDHEGVDDGDDDFDGDAVGIRVVGVAVEGLAVAGFQTMKVAVLVPPSRVIQTMKVAVLVPQ
jgi:hypothetical protein